jgi:hypothetical protein
MKRRFIIILVIETVFLFVFLLFALLQKKEADKQRVSAMEAKQATEILRVKNFELEQKLNELQRVKPVGEMSLSFFDI